MRGDLISRRALLKKATMRGHCLRPLVTAFHMCVDVKDIEKAPAVDAVEVVRCWECKHRESRDCPMCHEVYYYDEDDGGDYYVIDRAVDPNGFCCAGERRDDG